MSGQPVMIGLIAVALLACLSGVYALVSQPPTGRTPSEVRSPSEGRSPSGPIAFAAAQPGAEDILELQRRHLELPVQGVNRSELMPSFDQRRGDHAHEAIDILAPRGTPAVAVDDGSVAKLFSSKQGGLTIYLFDAIGRYAYYYAHLDRYAEDLDEGDHVTRGEIIGYVGSTGNANPASPHLHFSIFRLGPERRWWEGTPVDPYPVFVTTDRR